MSGAMVPWRVCVAVSHAELFPIFRGLLTAATGPTYTLAMAPDRAITVVDAALREFEFEMQMAPRVILLPRRVFEQFLVEKATVDAAMPYEPPHHRCEDDAWADVRVVEHEGIEAPEVY